MIVIQMRNADGSHRPYNEWRPDSIHTFPEIETTEFPPNVVWTLYAHGNDFQDIKLMFLNIPIPKNTNECKWVGEMAEFLINNMRNAVASA